MTKGSDRWRGAQLLSGSFCRRAAPVATVLLLLVLAGQARAQGPEGKFRSGDRIVVPADEVVDGDLYIFAWELIVDGAIRGDLVAVGGNVTVNGTVDGDLTAAGFQVAVSGTIKGDITAAGSSLEVRGPVTGDVRVAGGSLALSGAAGEDVVVAAGTVDVPPPAIIGGDLLFTAGTATVQGSVAGDIRGDADSYERSGTLGGREEVHIREREPAVPTPPSALDVFLGRVRAVAGLALVGVLWSWLRPASLDGLARRLRDNPLKSLGWGLLAWAGVMTGLMAFTLGWILLAIILGIVTLDGLAGAVVAAGLLGDAAVVLALVLSAVFVCWVIAGNALGVAIVKRVAPALARNRFLGLMFGIFLIVALGSIQFIDLILTILIVVSGMGVLAQATYDTLKPRRAPPPALAVTAGEGPPQPAPPLETSLASPVGAGLAGSAPTRAEAPVAAEEATSGPASEASGPGLALRLFGIPVRVRLWFFILAVFIAGPSRLDGAEILRVVIFVAIIFTAVLAHELGHAAAIRAIGHRPLLIEFHGLGGATHWQPDRPVSAARSVAVSFAGPAVGIALGGPAFIAHVAMSALGGPTEGLAAAALGAFWWVNLGWGVLNLLPIIPLDGGRIMSAFIGGIAPGKGMQVAHVISILLAVGLGLFALTLQAWWTAFLCGLFVMANVQGLRMLGQGGGGAPSPGRAGTSG